MTPNVATAVYALLGFSVVLLIFLGVLAVVHSVRSAHWPFKWESLVERPRHH